MKTPNMDSTSFLLNRFLTCVFLFLSLNLVAQNQLNSSDLQLIYGDYTKNLVSTDSSNLSKCCSYGQVRPDETDFMEGPSGIVLYGFLWSDGLKDYLKNLSQEDNHHDFYDVSSIEQLSLVKIFRVGSTNFSKWDNAKFSFYNSEFVIWVKENLIPDPELLIGDKKAQSWYSYFRRFFRLMTESYLFISQKTEYKKESDKYLDQVNNVENFDGLKYLSDRYSNKISGYEIPNSCEVVAPFKDYMAIGFWLRRKVDGTNDEFYDCLSYLMTRYDQAWFDSINKQYSDMSKQ